MPATYCSAAPGTPSSALPTLIGMQRPRPECGGDLDDLEPEAEMGSRPVRYWCLECELSFESDPAGGVREVDDRV